jgi:hypothetical protein
LCLYTTLTNIQSSGEYFDYSWIYLHSTVGLRGLLHYFTTLTLFAVERIPYHIYINPHSRKPRYMVRCHRWLHFLRNLRVRDGSPRYIFEDGYGLGNRPPREHQQQYSPNQGTVDFTLKVSTTLPRPKSLLELIIAGRWKPLQTHQETAVAYGGPFRVMYSESRDVERGAEPELRSSAGVKVMVEREQAVV